MLFSELSNFIRNHLHLKVPMEVGVSDIPRRINDVPKCHVFRSLNDANVALFRASPQLRVCRTSTHASLFVCTAPAYCLSTGPIFFSWANTFACILDQAVRVFFLTCAFQRSLASSVMPRYFAMLKLPGNYADQSLPPCAGYNSAQSKPFFPPHTTMAGVQLGTGTIS